MKKLIIAIIIMFIILANVDNQKFTLRDYFDGEYTAYTKEFQQDSVDLGFCYMVKDSESVIGESVKMDNLEVGSAIRDLEMKVAYTEYLNGTTLIYGYTKKISDSVNVDGEKINIQIAYNDEYTVIGWPLILGSF